MNLIRLGDKIEVKERVPEQARSFQTADSLAQRVLNPPLFGEQMKYYLQSHPLASRAEFDSLLPEGTPQLGEFETLLIGKLLNPPLPVLCVVGPMGCGKTTTMKYVEAFVRQRIRCGKCNSERIIAHIDFNDYIALNECAETEVKERILSILCDELRARVCMHACLSKKEELVDFWNYEIECFRNGRSYSKAFRRIISKSERSELLDSSSPSRQVLVAREQVRESLKEDKGLLLDYLIRLWRYLLRVRYHGNRGCAFIVLDNIDRVAPMVQKQVIELVHTHARLEGPTFVLIVRPETFLHQGLGTGLIDVIHHVGPSPARVVLNRIERFCENPDNFFDRRDGLTLEEFAILKTHIQRLFRMIRSDRRDPFTVFVNRACGRSIRSTIVFSQGLFMMSIADMKNPEVSLRDAVRRCVTAGETQYRWTPSSVVEQMFSVSTARARGLLVKPRILRYLGRTPGKLRRVDEIVHALSGFGYDTGLVLDAMTDLMRINRQLIRSNGFDAYHDHNGVLKKYGGHFVTLTEIGEAYINHLITDVHYVQEVMLDTVIDGDRFPAHIEYGYLSEKFHLLYLFLNEVRRTDYVEMSQFIKRWGVKAYVNMFGEHMISLDIIQGIYPAAVRILEKAAKDYPQYAPEYEEVRQDFKSLALKVEADNNELLGIWVSSVTQDDDDAK